MMQLDIFDTPPPVSWVKIPPYQSGSKSSKRGAEHAKPRAGTQKARIMAALIEQGSYGATSCELRKLTGIAQASTMSARINSLVNDDKLIKKSGKERLSDDGVLIDVYEVVI